MCRIRVRTTFFLSFIIAAVIVLPAFGSQERVVARGDDGFVVTEADVNAMRAVDKGGFRPTDRDLVKGTVRTVLFAWEAGRRKVACPAAEDSEGFDRTIAMAGCYMQQRLKEMELAAGAVESFYRVNWKRFQDRETGEMRPLAKVEVGIRQHILSSKKKYYFRWKFEELCQKYNVVFTGSGS